MDIGTPERYLQASWDILEGSVETDARCSRRRRRPAGRGGRRGRPGGRGRRRRRWSRRAARWGPAPRWGPNVVIGRARSSAGTAAIRARSWTADCRVGPGASVDRLDPGRRCRRRRGGDRPGRRRDRRGGADRGGLELAAGARVPPGERWPRERVPRRDPRGRQRAASSTTSSTFPTTSATRSGGSSPPGSSRRRPVGWWSAGWAARASAARWPAPRWATASRGR